MLKMLKKARTKAVEGVGSLYEKLRKYKILHYSAVQVFILAVITTFVVECLSKTSILKTFKWMFTHPLIFLVNVLIVGIVYTLAVSFRHKYFVYSLVAFAWLAIGVSNCVIIHSRVTPLTFGDMKNIFTVKGIFSKYLSRLDIALIIIGVVIAIALIVNAFFKFPIIQGKFNRPKKIFTSLIIMLVYFGLIQASMYTGIMSVNFINLRNAYQEYGVAYCFSNSVVNTGINKPTDYSKDKIENIIDNIATDSVATDLEASHLIEGDDAPNVIFVQLESFFNVNRLDGVEFSENPIPVMTGLYENYNTGLLNVPSISAGTANTEFEVLTGMNMNDFGPGEYPFNTVLSKDMTTESIAFNLKEYGYETHGIHNNTAEFYNRNKVYPNLGIDTFTSIEYMVNAETNQLGWAKDEVLTNYINQALDSTKAQDFVFAVSVQGHGAYPDEDVLEDDSLLVSLEGIEGTVGEYNFAYYLEQLREMDEFVSELITSLNNRDEKTVLVIYGDHLPGFDFAEEDLNSGTLYDTEYVIWTNFDVGERRVVDLQAYQLSSYVMELLDYDSGLINKVHQNKDIFKDDEYLEVIKTLEYDMLYGDMNCWGGENPYVSGPVTYAYDDIVIHDVEFIPDSDEKNYYYVFVNGENFTKYSKVMLNDEDVLETIYRDEHRLFIPGVKLRDGDSLSVAQLGSSSATLSQTVPYYCTNQDLYAE